MTAILVFLVIIFVVVVIHELGHYLMARLCGVQTLVFSVGMGPELCGVTSQSGTRWRISLFPVGGYIQLRGQEKPKNTPDNYSTKNVWQRMAILFAGPFANVILAIVIFSSIFFLYGGLGISQIPEKETYSLFQSIISGVIFSKDLALSQVTEFGRVMQGEVGIEHLYGPIGIVKISGDAFDKGGVRLVIMFTGMLSLVLAIINLLPIPLLDGGHIFFCFIEVAKGSPVSERIQGIFSKIGLYFILTLSMLLLVNDIVNLTR